MLGGPVVDAAWPGAAVLPGVVALPDPLVL